jgi:hypothetical protein
VAVIVASDNEFPKAIFVEGAAPGTPPAGMVYIYAKADGLMYQKDDAGTETALGDSGGAATHIADTTDAHDASAISIADAGAHFTGTDVEAALQELGSAGPGGGGTTFRTTADMAYPTTFAGDVYDAAALEAAATDVAAFDTRTVDGDIWKLVNQGSADTGRVRVALGTTKAGAFDVQCCLTPLFGRWGASGDTHAEFRLSQSDDTQIAVMRMHAFFGDTASVPNIDLRTKLGTGNPAGAGSDFNPSGLFGRPLWLRVTRDGSNNLLAFWGVGRQPMAWLPILDGGIGAMTASVAGTLARVEFASTNATSAASQTSTLYIDFLQSL